MNTYTTLKGNVWTYPLSRKQWAGIKKSAKSRFNGSLELFDFCWRKYQREILPGTDNPENIENVTARLDSLASEAVNDSGSRFYIYG